jgi:hypothetical protein
MAQFSSLPLIRCMSGVFWLLDEVEPAVILRSSPSLDSRTAVVRWQACQIHARAYEAILDKTANAHKMKQQSEGEERKMTAGFS